MRSGGERLAAIPPGVKGRKIFSALYDGRHKRQIRPRTHVREFFSRKSNVRSWQK
nr:MAG TPA: hypothetical protein [Bacteriophage sp.]